MSNLWNAYEGRTVWEEMAEFCAPFQVEAGLCKDIEEAKQQIMEYFPNLRRRKNR